jgi:hypothetical protein
VNKESLTHRRIRTADEKKKKEERRKKKNERRADIVFAPDPAEPTKPDDIPI